jgi:hypothetical protein
MNAEIEEATNNTDTANSAVVADQEQEEIVEKRERPSPSKPKKMVPRDFSQRVANRIISINERELDEEIASTRVSELVYRNMHKEEMYQHFVDTTELLLKKEDAEKYAATTWTALVWHQDEHPEYKTFIEGMLQSCAYGHVIGDRPNFEDEDTRREFSAYGYIIGEVFIQMMKLNSDLYNILSEMFGYLIRHEMAKDLDKKSGETKRKGISGRKKHKEEKVATTKKLYDDVVDYCSHRGEFRSDTLNQKNPNEYILILADRMRSTRRYIIQDIMNKHALEKKKLLKKELREREASAEEVISAARPFSNGLFLYWVEKRYNFKYLAVEKVRITLQIIAISLGMGAIGVGFLGLSPLTLFEGIFTGVLMFLFAKTICSRYFFSSYFPMDVTAELEGEVGTFTPVFRKLSLTQINLFLSKQIKNPGNAPLLHLLPEYVKYVFAVMPDRNDILLKKEEINEFMERMEVNLTKQQRGR